jgi:lipoate-protein ligase A
MLVDAPCSGTVNMARDEALALNARIEGMSTLRAYRFVPPAITIGRFQRLDGGIDTERCARVGIDIVRRPTGGLAILHQNDFTYSVAAQALETGPRERDRHFDRIASAVLASLRSLGISASQVRHESRGGGRGDWCFDGVFGVDLEWAGKKICGSAQRLFKGAVLQHGSLFLERPETSLVLDGNRDPDGSSGGPGFATLKEAAGRTVTWDEVLDAFVCGFGKALGASLEPGNMTDRETELAELLVSQKYSDKEWLRHPERSGGPE